MSVQDAATLHSSPGADHRIENFFFPRWQGWRRSVALYLYYLAVIIALLLMYGRGGFYHGTVRVPGILKVGPAASAMSLPASEIFDRLQLWATRFPDRLAHRTASVGSTPTTGLTYRELLSRSRAVAGYLRARLPDSHAPVVVLGHKEPEMLAGFLGVVGSGRPYVPLDSGLPAHRVESVVVAANAELTLTPEAIASLPPAEEAELLTPQIDRPFYIIFTSGSTGDPKGVVITAGCLDAFLDWMLSEHPFVEGGETFLNQAPVLV